MTASLIHNITVINDKLQEKNIDTNILNLKNNSVCLLHSDSLNLGEENSLCLDYRLRVYVTRDVTGPSHFV